MDGKSLEGFRQGNGTACSMFKNEENTFFKAKEDAGGQLGCCCIRGRWRW